MHSNPSLSGTIPDNRTRQPRKPRPASVAAHSQQPFATLPDSLGSLSQLQWLSGTVPDSLGSLEPISLCTCTCTATLLVYLDMHSNPLAEWHHTRQVAASESSISLCT
eukprot:TRINITY_DN2008_c0_g1_i120.p2 TRINITY_DN2008_c0_g1~~TRINITY_DN2008_c0_g1_i120.p2  ORF type:complete len:108 (+),score=7.97 TRINITY_DN2008_c0_g1_i120:448-771(+)